MQKIILYALILSTFIVSIMGANKRWGYRVIEKLEERRKKKEARMQEIHALYYKWAKGYAGITFFPEWAAKEGIKPGDIRKYREWADSRLSAR